VDGLFILPKFMKRRLTRRLSLEPRLDRPYRAAAAGFWYLYQENPDGALNAFLVLENFLYGREMCILSQTLSRCKKNQI
jgi:hypothetical protein